MSTSIITAELERAIRSYLAQERTNTPKARTEKDGNIFVEVPPGGERILFLYTSMADTFEGLTTGFFNKVLADMRRAGIIEIFRSWVYITNLAWALHQHQQQEQRAAQQASGKAVQS